ncbi:thiosulfate/3-mercaptopyruvate sulfurtransferase [Paenibacillus phyllosphaerae]|uniref:Thiosulfate/3-mercaptopyruvate sulfurtransferase n=1 Tax=Paenibacillus phyllosphaerae TaxID=274593 RepID=A0A7W5B6J7_9BACL|nr:sulfurtransferase [Paenibacillus phyllosphaerae]MBB3114621.1 thiosulfate/3-mercaptopyruvate sulfurtransferase [Paenibacillus phyllosphaerae]
MSNLISVSEAYRLLGDPSTVFVDVRFVLGEPEAGYQAYLRSHVPGAVFFDLNADLSGPKQEHGGGHPLPDIARFGAKLGSSGIDNDTHVIVYDDQGGSIAARLWWMLKHVGHERVQLLAEGYTGWVRAGYPVTDELPNPALKVYEAEINAALKVGMDDVRSGLRRAGRTLIDARVHERYTGADTSKYAKAGHIPGAVNYYWEEGSPNGVFLGGEQQRLRFRNITQDDEIIVYCGSGVTACPNVLALIEAGYTNVKLYVGSWNDWISYPDNPIETGEA